MQMQEMMKSAKKEQLMAMYNGMQKEMSHEEMSPEDKEKKESVENRLKSIDVSEHVSALMNGEGDLSEEFKSKAATIFEAAVKSKVRSEVERMEDEYKSELEENINTTKEELTEKVDDGNIIIISAEIESQISQLDESEQSEFLSSLSLEDSGLNKIINSGYSILNLVTYFTAGPEEARAWTIKVDTLAPDAAGKIHTDFKKGFIRAETVSYNDFIECNGEGKARELGKLRSEGKEYNVQDGDVMHFLFNN